MSLVLARTSSLSESESERAGEPPDDGSLPARLANDLDEGDDIRFSPTYIIRIQVLYILVVATQVSWMHALPFSSHSAPVLIRAATFNFPLSISVRAYD